MLVKLGFNYSENYIKTKKTNKLSFKQVSNLSFQLLNFINFFCFIFGQKFQRNSNQSQLLTQ